MKPKLGRKVYCIYRDGIFVDTVGWTGKESFIVNGFGTATESDSWEWLYDDYNVNWFTSLSKAKKALIEHWKDRYEGKLRVVKFDESWYPLEFC